MRTTREQVIKAASDIADRDGLSGLSLKAVAQALGLRTPSLYNHIGSLEELLLEVAHRGMGEMNGRMTLSAVGSSGDAAVQAAAGAYLGYMLAHPGVYETIQWACWHQSEETGALLAEYYALLKKLVLSMALNIADTEPVVRLLSGFLHGYTTQNLGRALQAPESAQAELSEALATVLLGIHDKYSC